MKSDRVIRPGKRKPSVSTRPSQAGAEIPLHEYIVPPSDGKGRSVSITVSMPPSFRRMSSRLVSLKTLPFETEQDVMRWAVRYGLRYLVEHTEDKQLTTEFNQLMSWSAIAAIEQENLFYEQTLVRIFRKVKQLERYGHYGKAIEISETVWRQSDRIGDPYWCKRARGMAKGALDRMKGIAGRNGHGSGGAA